MGAVFINKFKFDVPPLNGKDEGWHFECRVPNHKDTVDLEKLLASDHKVKAAMIKALYGDKDLLNTITANGGDIDTALKNPSVLSKIMLNAGPEMFEIGEHDTEKRHKVALIMQRNAEPPRNLFDDDNSPLTWEKMREYNEPMTDEVLCNAAIELLGHLDNHRMKLRQETKSDGETVDEKKSMPSSLP
jgi:hypothetical protein